MFRLMPRLLSLFVVTLLYASATQANNCPLQDYSWRNITVGAGGFAPNLIYSTAEKGLAYLRTDMGGVYRRDEQHPEWIPLQDGMKQSNYFGIESIALDPSNADIVHVAAGMYKHEPAAMLRSFDRGNSWEITPVPFRMGGNEDGRGMGERLAVDPINGNILFFGSRHDGLFKSVDQGKSWQTVKSFPHQGKGVPSEGRSTNAGISFIHFVRGTENKTSTHTIIAAVADNASQHLYLSLDAGKTWAPIKGEPKSTLRPAQAVQAGNNLFIAYSNNTGPNGVTNGAVYRLNLASATWTDITPGHNHTPNKKGSSPGGGFMGITASASNPNRIVVATMNRWQPHDTIFISNDAGSTWENIGPQSKRDVRATPYLYWGNPEADFGWWIAGLALNPFDDTDLSYTTGATVYRTTQLHKNNNKHTNLLWTPWIKGIEQTAVITLTSLPEGPELLSGFGDISGFTHTNFDESPQVMFTTPVFANTNSIDYAPLQPNIVVRSGTQPHRDETGKAPTLAWSNDHGMNWKPLSVPEHKTDSTSLPKRHDLSGNHAIIVSADGETFIFTGPRAMISANKGKSWQPVKGLPLNVRPIADKSDGKRFYGLDFEKAEMYLSHDGGFTFSHYASNGLPKNLKTMAPTWREKMWPLLAQPNTKDQLWLVTGKKLYFSQDAGKNFRSIASAANIQELAFGKPLTGDVPAMLAIGHCDGERRLLRSDNLGKSWNSLNDKHHQYGQRFRTLAGDPRNAGRIYVATDGRGIVMGEPKK